MPHIRGRGSGHHWLSLSVRRLASLPVLCTLLLATATTVACDGSNSPDQHADSPRSTPSAGASEPSTRPGVSGDRSRRPLRGLVVVLDPGHQLGNGTHPTEINRPVPAGGFTKPCNTTGTATDAGVPEATIAWQLAGLIADDLRRLGARVRLTRQDNSAEHWGPCVDARGRAGNPARGKAGADLKISLHADGNIGGGPGFHVIVPERLDGWTDDIARPSARLGRLLRDSLRRDGLPVAGYVGTDGLDVRGDLATLNLSDVPTVMLEAGNLRDPGDARRLTGPAGQRRYAEAVVSAVRRFR